MNIKNQVRRLQQKYLTRDPFELAAALGYLVVFANLKGLRGFFQYYKRNCIIYIANDLSPREQSFVCAHEIGHAQLHRKLNTVFLQACTFSLTDKLEIEANTFAVELLITDEELLEYQHLSSQQLAQMFGVEPKMLAYKLKKLETSL